MATYPRTISGLLDYPEPTLNQPQPLPRGGPPARVNPVGTPAEVPLKPNGKIDWAKLILLSVAGIGGGILGGKRGALSGLAGAGQGILKGQEIREEWEDRTVRQGLAAKQEGRAEAEAGYRKTADERERRAERERRKEAARLNFRRSDLDPEDLLTPEEEAAERADMQRGRERLSGESYGKAVLGAPSGYEPEGYTDPETGQFYPTGLAAIPEGRLSVKAQADLRESEARRQGYLMPKAAKEPYARFMFEVPTGKTGPDGDPITVKMVMMSDGKSRPAMPGEVMGDAQGGGLGATAPPDTLSGGAGAGPAKKPAKPFNEKASIQFISDNLKWTKGEVEQAVVVNMRLRGLSLEDAIKRVALDNNVLLMP